MKRIIPAGPPRRATRDLRHAASYRIARLATLGAHGVRTSLASILPGGSWQQHEDARQGAG
ncbi:MAG TPA: hypothetical protein VII16_13790, partial [Actinomycetes bacterium]